MMRPAEREYRYWVLDSRRWNSFEPRDGDIIIATYPKCGTTWMQQIVALLVFQDPAPRPVMDISVWIDRRFPETIEAVMERVASQGHRRFLKSHLPADGLPMHDMVRYIHVARDGRDVSMSFHNHALGLKPEIIERFDAIGLADPAIGRTYPRPLADPAAHFHRWLTEGVAPGDEDGTPLMSFFHFERTWWNERSAANVLLVHYNDLKNDLAAEMKRVAAFLQIEVAPKRWPDLVRAAGFETMRRHGDDLMGNVAGMFRYGAAGFFHRGSNDRWRGVFAEADLARYEALAASRLTPDCARWLAEGRGGGEPGETAPATTVEIV